MEAKLSLGHNGNCAFQQPKPTTSLLASSYLPSSLSVVLGAAARQWQSASSSPPQNTSDDSTDLAKSNEPMEDCATQSTPSHSVSRATSLRSMASTAATSADNRSCKRTRRPRTILSLAHPPPCTGAKQKLHLRPRTLLQLHQVKESSRPIPVVEVYSSSKAPATLVKKRNRLFKSKDKLGGEDVVVAQAAGYDSEDIGREDRDRSADRAIFGTISQGEDKDQPRTEIIMTNGSRWEAKAMSNGRGYDFTMIDEHGLSRTARWVARSQPVRTRSPKHSRTQSSLEPLYQGSDDNKKFTFSTISPNSRRHPVIATMTRANIEVYDNYSIPSAPEQARPASNKRHSRADSDIATLYSTQDDAGGEVDDGATATDDALRNFIIVSGIWVAFRENWSTVFKYAAASVLPAELPSKLSSPSNTQASFATSPQTTTFTRPSSYVQSEVTHSTPSSSSINLDHSKSDEESEASEAAARHAEIRNGSVALSAADPEEVNTTHLESPTNLKKTASTRRKSRSQRHSVNISIETSDNGAMGNATLTPNIGSQRTTIQQPADTPIEPAKGIGKVMTGLGDLLLKKREKKR